MAKRALIFSLSYYPHLVGGAEVAVKEITDRLGGEFEFDMVTLYAGTSRFERIGNVNVYRVGPKIRISGIAVPHISYLIKFCYVAAAFCKSLALHHRRDYDFTWSMMASFNAFSNLFFKWLHPGVPFFLTLQEGDSPEHIKKATSIMYPLYKQIFKKADRIQAISKYLVEYGRNMGATCPILLIPNAVDYAFFSQVPPQSQVRALQSELGISPDDTIIITTSRLVHKNGVGSLIDAMTYFPKKVKLLILGSGPLDKFLMEKTRLLNLNDQVAFAGFVPNRELPLYLRLAQVFVRPSLSEGFGISFIEAMAAELPVVATPVGGIIDFIVDGKTGLFCRPEDPKSIAEKIELLLNDQDLRTSIVKNAREMVKEKYDWSLVAEGMRGEFAKLTP
jgi:glycosyltransferase involved in cell wall biosynthesis